jgi:hypothetical protein
MNNNERLYKISEIADIAKANKTKVWRYIRDNNISERSMKGNAKLYSEHTKDVIIKAFSSETKADTSRILLEQIDILKGELERKNDQLDKMQSLLDQQQQLNLSTNRQNEKLLDTTTNNTPSQDDSPSQSDDTDVLKPTEGNSKGVENKTPKKGLFGWLRR